MMLLSLQPVKAASTLTPSKEEQTDQANSWRYEDGELKSQESLQSKSKATLLPRLAIRPTTATAQGIDVSHNNGTIQWEEVLRSQQIDYAILRVGYGMDQTDQDDQQWSYNSAECERLGIPYGVYLYSYATTTERAVSEANHVIRLIQGKKLDYPIYYDMEDDSTKNLSKAQHAANAKAFFDTLKAAGYTNVGVYANKDWFESRLTDSLFSQYPRWIAQYADACTYQKSYHMWQFTESEKVPGITGAVDMNYKIGNWGSSVVFAPKVSMNKTSLSLTAGNRYQLKASYTRPNNYTSAITWKSSNPSVATVSASGYVTTKLPGKVTITASIATGARAVCNLTIKPKTNKVSKLKKSGSKSIKVYWSKVSGVSGYQVYMSTKKKSGYKKVKTLSYKKRSYTKTKLKKKKRYYFKVRSYKTVGGTKIYSSFSSVKSMKR